jgi:hypothetical protein
LHRGLKVVVDGRALGAGKAGLADIKSLLVPGSGKGDVTVVVAIGGVPGVAGARDIELVLPGRFDTSPDTQGALSAVAGVMDVMEV